LNIENFPFRDRNKYELMHSEYAYSLPPCRTLYVGANNGDLDVRIVDHDDNDFSYDVNDSQHEFWIGATLYWYDAMAVDMFYNSIQIDAIARLAQYLGYVPNEDQINKYAIPNKSEVCTWFEMVTLLKTDGVERHEG